MYVDKLHGIVNKYHNTYHSTIKMKPADVKNNTCIDSGKKTNDEDPKYKNHDRVRIPTYKNISPKGYTPNWSEKGFVITKAKKIVPCY